MLVCPMLNCGPTCDPLRPPTPQFNIRHTNMLVSKNARICVTSNAKPKICVTPNVNRGGYRISERGGGGGGGGRVTKTRLFRAHTRNVFPLFMKRGGGGGVRNAGPPPPVSRCNVGCVGSTGVMVRVGHVHFRLFVLISFALRSQREPHFQ